MIDQYKKLLLYFIKNMPKKRKIKIAKAAVSTGDTSCCPFIISHEPFVSYDKVNLIPLLLCQWLAARVTNSCYIMAACCLSVLNG